MTTKLTEWLTGCPCCGSNEDCDCDLDGFYLELQEQRISELEIENKKLREKILDLESKLEMML